VRFSRLLTSTKPAAENRSVGSISGLVAGISLKEKLAVENFTVRFFLFLGLFTYHPHGEKFQIYEREHEVGGTWRVSSHYYLFIVGRTTNIGQSAREQDNTYPVRTEFFAPVPTEHSTPHLFRSHLTLILIQSFALGNRTALATFAPTGTPSPKTRTLIGALAMLAVKRFTTTGSTSSTSTNSAHTFSVTPS
jgi:hypothetical protein